MHVFCKNIVLIHFQCVIKQTFCTQYSSLINKVVNAHLTKVFIFIKKHFYLTKPKLNQSRIDNHLRSDVCDPIVACAKCLCFTESIFTCFSLQQVYYYVKCIQQVLLIIISKLLQTLCLLCNVIQCCAFGS